MPELDEYFIAKAEEWGKTNSVAVTVERINQNDIDTRLAAAVQSQNGPDMFQSMFNWPWRFADQLVDVSDVAKDLGGKLGGWHDGIDIYAHVEGTYLGIPLAFFPNAFVYRKSMLGCRRRDGADDLGRVHGGGQATQGVGQGDWAGDGPLVRRPAELLVSLAWAHGGKEVEEDGSTVALNSPETLTAVEALVDLFDNVLANGALSWDDSSNNRAFLANQISTTLNGNSIYFNAKQTFPDIFADIGTFGIPSGPAGEFSLQNTQTHGIMKYSKNASAAKEFLTWFMQPEQYNPYLEAGGGYYVGPLKQYDDNPVWKTDQRIEIYRDLSIGGSSKWPGWPGPPSRASSQALSRHIIVDLFAKAASREFTPQEAVDWAIRQLESVYKPS